MSGSADNGRFACRDPRHAEGSHRFVAPPFSPAATLRRARLPERRAGRVLAVVRLAHAAQRRRLYDRPAGEADRRAAAGGARRRVDADADAGRARRRRGVRGRHADAARRPRRYAPRGARLPARRVVAQPRGRATDGVGARAARGRRRGERARAARHGRRRRRRSRAQDDRRAARRARPACVPGRCDRRRAARAGATRPVFRLVQTRLTTAGAAPGHTVTTESSFAAFDANRRILRGFFGYPQRMWITLLKSRAHFPQSRAGRPSGPFGRPYAL
ncbi:hypothetical protein F01_90038 [Burkholderia cenocepacia]|nr:hypothetical protein F01_90038 [Burkholderia cenocepacia]